LSLLDQAISYAEGKIDVNDIHEINGTLPQSQLEKLFNGIREKNVYEVFNIIDEYDRRGKNFVKITDEFISFLRNILLAIQAPDYLNNELQEADFFIQLGSSIELDTVVEYIEIFNRGMGEMKLSNNPRLNIEILLIKLMGNKIVEKNYPQEKENFKDISSKKIELKEEKIKNLSNKEEKEVHDDSYNLNMKKLMNIRINNTLCNFDKKLYLEGKKKIDLLNQYVLHPEYSKYASLILDGELKAVGGKYYIFVFSDSGDSDIYNENVLKIDELLEQIFYTKICSISVSNKDWEIIKHEFNNHVKQYNYEEETELYTSFLKNNEKSTNSIESSFVDLIEYK